MPAASPPLALHDLVEAILNHPHPDFSTVEAGEIMRVHPVTISEACRDNRIESTRTSFRGGGKFGRYRITKAAMLRFLWQHTTGDRQIIRAALEARCPKILAAIESCRVPAARASTTPRAKSDPFAGHPDLFS